MSNIGSITTDDSVGLSDRLLGTEASTRQTKNYMIGDILALMDTQTSTSNTVLFDRIFGYTHGTWDTPITGSITVDLTGAKDGACACVIWSGSSNPTISGVGYVLNKSQGTITEAGTYTIYLHYINPTGVSGDGKFNVSFFGVDTATVTANIAPITLTITEAVVTS